MAHGQRVKGAKRHSNVSAKEVGRKLKAGQKKYTDQTQTEHNNGPWLKTRRGWQFRPASACLPITFFLGNHSGCLEPQVSTQYPPKKCPISIQLTASILEWLC